MGNALLGANGGDDFRFGVEGDAVLVVIFFGDFLAQTGDAIADAVAVVAGVFRRLGQFFDDGIGGWVGGVCRADRPEWVCRREWVRARKGQDGPVAMVPSLRLSGPSPASENLPTPVVTRIGCARFGAKRGPRCRRRR